MACGEAPREERKKKTRKRMRNERMHKVSMTPFTCYKSPVVSIFHAEATGIIKITLRKPDNYGVPTFLPNSSRWPH